MGSRAVLIATNREIKEMPAGAQRSATAALARKLAREVDAGDRAAAGPLMRALDQLRKLAAAETARDAAAAAAAERAAADADLAAATTGADHPEDDPLDQMARMRAARIADAAGVVSPIGGDDRRRRGPAAG